MADKDSDAQEKRWKRIVAEEAHKVCREFADWTKCPHPWECHDFTCCPVDSDFIDEHVEGDEIDMKIWSLYDDDAPPQSWIVEGLVGEKRKGVIFGHKKQKKTMC